MADLPSAPTRAKWQPTQGSPPSRAAHAGRPSRAERTLASRRRSVELAIAAMRENLFEPLPLARIARAAAASPYHLIRLFRQVTGVTPRRFLSALRIQAAKRLLLTTDFSATAVCYEVGYNSIGSFTSRFTELVGLSPRQLKRLARRLPRPTPLPVPQPPSPPAHAAIGGAVLGPAEFDGLIFVGVFRTPIPEGRPLRCAVLRRPGAFRVGPLEPGTYYLLAMALPDSIGVPEALVQDRALRGRTGPLAVRRGATTENADILLRPPQTTDYPILPPMRVVLATYARDLERAGNGASRDA